MEFIPSEIIIIHTVPDRFPLQHDYTVYISNSIIIMLISVH